MGTAAIAITVCLRVGSLRWARRPSRCVWGYDFLCPLVVSQRLSLYDIIEKHCMSHVGLH